MDAQHFKTQEAILAFCLDIASCEFLDPRQPCANIFDAEILGKLGYFGQPLCEGAKHAWQDEKKGHVEYIFKQTPRLLELIRAYRDQCLEIEKAGGDATTIVIGLLRTWKAGSILDDEALLRIACVNLKTRIDFVNIWKKMTPVLRISTAGKSKTRETGKGTVVEKPGFTVVSLNASEKTRKHLGL